MKKLISLLMAGTTVIILSGCGGGGGPIAPSDDDNISSVKLTDLRLGYLTRGLILTSGDYYNIGYDLGFCNDEVTIRMIFGDLIDDHYSVGTFEVVGEDTIVFGSGSEFIVDSGILEEGETYTLSPGEWYLGSISKKECVVDPI